MPSSKNHIQNAKLYLILDTQVLDYQNLLTLLKVSVRFGIDVVQLRDKFGSAKDILFFSKHALKITKGKIPFILNDRVDLVQLAKADGVHLGQDDIACKDARKMLGEKAIIGVSCQKCPQVVKAKRDGADYVGFGSVFKTLTKPDRSPMDVKTLEWILKKSKLPVFPIGGIDTKNITGLKAMGATRAAVCRDILLAKDPGSTIEEFRKILDS